MKTLLCYGDSNTHGTPPMYEPDEMGRFGPDVRWPGVLAAALGPPWHVIEEGLPGRTTVHDDPIEGVHKNGFAVLPAILETHRPLDAVVLMLGTNDVKARFGVGAGEIAQSAERLAKLILTHQAGPEGRAPALLVVAPPPIGEVGIFADMFAGGARKSRGVAKALRPMAEAHGAAFLDAGTVIRTSDLDGIHFDAAEHAKLGRAIAAEIKRLFGD